MILDSSPELHYTDTAWELATLAGVTVQTIRNYAKEGLLDFVLMDDGAYLFKQDQATRVKEIGELKKERLPCPRIAKKTDISTLSYLQKALRDGFTLIVEMQPTSYYNAFLIHKGSRQII